MPHVDTLHEHRGEPSQGAALSSRTSHWQVHPAGRSSYNFQTPVVQEDKELPRATEPGQKQKKAKVKQGGRQPAGFSSPLFFHTHGNARNSEVLFCFLEWLLYRAAVRPSMLRMYSPSDKVRVAQPYPLPVSLDLAQLGQYIHTSSSLFYYTFFAALSSKDRTPAEVDVLQHSDGLSGCDCSTWTILAKGIRWEQSHSAQIHSA